MTGARAFLRAAERLPVGDLDAVLGPAHATTLILAPHPDDESLGCGGLLAACAAAGRAVLVVVVSDGRGSHPGSRAWPAPRLIARREAETRAALAALSLDPTCVRFLRLPDQAVPDRGAELDAAVASVRRELSRDATVGAVVAAWRHDPHCDHAASWAIAAGVARALPGSPRLLAYPVWGWAYAHPIAGFPLPSPPRLPEAPRGYRFDVAARLPAKRRAIAAHATQAGKVVRDSPRGFALPPTLLALARRRFEVFLEEAP